MDDLSDEELVLMARSVDKEAFRLLIERYQAMAFSIVLQLIPQPEVAQDLVQEAVVNAYLSLGQLRDRTRFKNWFYGIVLNVCRNWRRVQRAQYERQHIPLSLDVLEQEELCIDDSYQSGSTDPQDIVEADEFRLALQNAVLALSVTNREVMFLFYYEGLHIDEIATQLKLSPVAVKSRLHKGRLQLKERLHTIYPELTFTASSKQIRKHRRIIMTSVKIADIQMLAHRVLIVLLDERGRRVLPLWLNPMEGQALMQRYKARIQPQDPVEPSPIDFTVNVLHATGGTVHTIRLEELQQHVLFAKVLLHSPNGDQEIETRLGDALALAERENCPIEIDDTVLEHLAMKLPPSDGQSLEQQLREVMRTLEIKSNIPVGSKLPRIKEPENLQFMQGLQRWELRGNFLHDATGATWEDYICGTDDIVPVNAPPGARSGFLKAQIPEPQGFADLRQALLADNFRGKRVCLSAEIKIEGVEQQAALYLRIIDPARVKGTERHLITFQGTKNWTRYETQAEVPEDSVFVLFGINLTGKGQIWIANVQLV